MSEATTPPADAEETASWGRQAPFTMAPDWVALSDITNTAKTLFWHIAMHVNNARGDSAAWPGRAALARRLGLSRADKVDRYVKELITLGAVEKTKRERADGSNLTNHYVVHQTPPPGYQGARDLNEVYAMEKAGNATNSQVKGGPPKEVPPPSPQTGSPPPPKRGQGGTPNGGPNKTKNNQMNTHPPSGGDDARDARVREAPPESGQGTIDGQSGDAAASARKARKARKTTKVPWPGRFEPDEKWRAWAAENYPTVDLDAQIADFNAYWSQPDNAQAVRDWTATWRTNVKQVAQRGGARGRGRPAAPAAPAELVEQATPTVEKWCGWWAEKRGPVTPRTRGEVLNLVVEALQGGATIEQAQQALKKCDVLSPKPWDFQDALVGAGGPKSRRQVESDETFRRASERNRILDEIEARTGQKVDFAMLMMEAAGQGIPFEEAARRLFGDASGFGPSDPPGGGTAFDAPDDGAAQFGPGQVLRGELA